MALQLFAGEQFLIAGDAVWNHAITLRGDDEHRFLRFQSTRNETQGVVRLLGEGASALDVRHIEYNYEAWKALLLGIRRILYLPSTEDRPSDKG